MRFLSAICKPSKIRLYFKIRTNADILVVKANLRKHPLKFNYVKVHKRVPTHYTGKEHQATKHYVYYDKGVCMGRWYDTYTIEEDKHPYWYDRTHSFASDSII